MTSLKKLVRELKDGIVFCSATKSDTGMFTMGFKNINCFCEDLDRLESMPCLKIGADFHFNTDMEGETWRNFMWRVPMILKTSCGLESIVRV